MKSIKLLTAFIAALFLSFFFKSALPFKTSKCSILFFKVLYFNNLYKFLSNANYN